MLVYTQVTAKQIQELKSPYLEWIGSDPSLQATKPMPIEHLKVGSLAFISDKEHIGAVIKAKPGIVIATRELENELKQKHAAVFLTPSISAAMAVINPLFDQKQSRWEIKIHPTAVIHPTAKIGEGTHVGPQCVIEKNVKIGTNCYLHPHVFIGADCEIGNNCELHPHVTVGSDGFGYVTDTIGNNHKIPQLGKVVIEDSVEIGGGCSIDRATLHETRIKHGCKLDNLVHIAHNCELGPNGLYAAGFMTAGSTKIGANFKCGGGVVVSDHITICDNVTLGGKSTVTKDITAPGAYTGYPLEPLREGLKTLASLPNLSELRKTVAAIQKKLGI